MRNQHKRVRRLGSTTLAVALLTVMTGTALAANPGTATTSTDQDLEVEITLDPDPGVANWVGDLLSVNAIATLSEGDLANVVYVLDVSGSMDDPTTNPFQDINPPPEMPPGPEDDCNGDGVEGSALDAACFGLIALNQSMGSNPNIDVGMVAFGDGAKTADMSPAAGLQPFTSPPDVGNDTISGSEVEQVIRSADTEITSPYNAGIGLFTPDITPGFGSRTNYDAALTAMNAAFATEPGGEVNRAVFISDGAPNTFSSGPGSPLAGVAPETIVDTFAIGFFAAGACGRDQPLAQIAEATGGVCTAVSDPSTLSAVLPVGLTNIANVDIAVNGNVVGSSTGSEPMTMQLLGVDITSDLVPGTNRIQAVATAEDATEAVADLEVEVVDMTLTPLHAVNELGSDNVHTVTATLLGSESVVSGVTITFEVTGQNPVGPSTVTTNASGMAEFTYAVPVEPDSIGVDTISASATIDGDTKTLQVTKEWVDTTPPEAACIESVNPSGRNIPKAPAKGGQGQNQDGFYELTGSDDVFGIEGLSMWLTDTGSGAVFGPFPVGTKVKYTEANGTTPRMKAMGGNNGGANGKGNAVDYHIWGNGDGSLVAIDGSDNTSESAACLVPNPPK